MHHELPERLDLDWYRAQARALLRSYRNGEQDAGDRVLEALGARPIVKLADTQRTIAREHGFARWADFKRWIEAHSPEPPVGRIGRQPIEVYQRRAEELVEQARRGDVDALRRVRAHVPRLSQFSGGELDLLDARIVVAREYGFPTWRDLRFYVDKAIREYEHRPTGSLADAFALIQSGDVAGLRRMLDDDPSLVRATYRGAANTMLEAIAQPEVFGQRLGIDLGVEPAIVELLIERGSDLDVPLNLAACFNRAELVRMLLDAGAPVDAVQVWGITPLQTAIYHGSRESADLLAPVGLVPDALYVAAGAGRVDDVERWFDAAGNLKAEAMRLRPNLADIGFPPAPPPRAEAQDVLDEAFALAACNGRLAVMERLLQHGASISGAAHLGLTALHFAVIHQRLDVARWLVERGADRSLRDAIHHRTPLGWAEHTATSSTIHGFLSSVSAPPATGSA
jgi:hypothetical protein